jgi:hypothetical protein
MASMSVRIHVLWDHHERASHFEAVLAMVHNGMHGNDIEVQNMHTADQRVADNRQQSPRSFVKKRVDY